MTILANGGVARVATWYSAVCLCFKPLPTQHSGITGTTCVRDGSGALAGPNPSPNPDPKLDPKLNPNLNPSLNPSLNPNSNPNDVIHSVQRALVRIMHLSLQVKFLLATLLAVSCIVPCVVRVIGTVLFATKVCTVHRWSFPPVSCGFLVDEHVLVQAIDS